MDLFHRRAERGHGQDGVGLSGLAARHARLGCGANADSVRWRVSRAAARKLLAQASRNGFFFVLDRTNGEHLLTAPFIKSNWSWASTRKASPFPTRRKSHRATARWCRPAQTARRTGLLPRFDPGTGLFYVVASQSYSVFYLTAEGKAEGFAGRDDFLNYPGTIKAIDYRTGDDSWTHDIGGMGAGLLTTAGNLLFAGDNSGHIMAMDSKTGKTLWHTTVGANQANGAITYELDGKQYVVVGAGDSLYAFALDGAAQTLTQGSPAERAAAR